MMEIPVSGQRPLSFQYLMGCKKYYALKTLKISAAQRATELHWENRKLALNLKSIQKGWGAKLFFRKIPEQSRNRKESLQFKSLLEDLMLAYRNGRGNCFKTAE